MSLKLNDRYLAGFIDAEEYENGKQMLLTAQKMLRDRNGAGSDFLGWVNLPRDYDRAEFARIKESARRICRDCH